MDYTLHCFLSTNPPHAIWSACLWHFWLYQELTMPLMVWGGSRHCWVARIARGCENSLLTCGAGPEGSWYSFFFFLFFSKLWLETDIIQILELNEAKLLSPQSLVRVTNPDSQTSWFRMYEIRPDNWYFWQVSRWCGFCWSHSGNCSPKGSSNLEQLKIRLQTPGVSQFSHSFEASLSLSHCC